MREIMKKINIKDLQVRVATERDEVAYKELFIFFYKALFQFANCLTKDPEASEEIVSDLMMKIWEMEDALVNVSNLRVYLYKSIRNPALNYLSRNRKYRMLPLEICTKPGFLDPENTLIQKELNEGIASAIRSLPEKCQVVYKLIRVDGLCYKEVAEITGISVKTVDRHLNNALHKLICSMKIYAD
jgi:RNA polymerase sigma-19 factor, ECF subfamily